MAEMTVGREMDAAVAKALGWHTKASTWGDTAHDLLVDSNGLTLYLVAEWQPSTSDSKAFAALDAMLEKHTGMGFEVVRLVGSQCIECTLTLADGRSFGCECGNRAEAICRAILALAEATDGH